MDAFTHLTRIVQMVSCHLLNETAGQISTMLSQPLLIGLGSKSIVHASTATITTCTPPSLLE